MQLKIGYLFQCPPWARSFWAFSPFLNHMRKFSKAKVMRCFCRRKIRKANPEFCSHPLPRRYQPLPVLHPQLRYPLSSCGSSLRYSRSPFYPSPDAQVQIFLFPFYAQIAPAGQRGSDAGSSASRERVEDPCSVPG